NSTLTFSGVYRHSFWYWNRDLAAVSGNWQIDITVNDHITRVLSIGTCIADTPCAPDESCQTAGTTTCAPDGQPQCLHIEQSAPDGQPCGSGRACASGLCQDLPVCDRGAPCFSWPFPGSDARDWVVTN